jgi:hypothetical protein
VLKRRRERRRRDREWRGKKRRELISDHFSDWIRETQHTELGKKRREEDITFRLLFLSLSLSLSLLLRCMYIYLHFCARACVCMCVCVVCASS